MATNMKYCHICKAMAFVKSQLSTVCTLDCGHMAKLKDVAAPETVTREELQRERAQRSRELPRPTAPPERPAPVRVIHEEPIVPSGRPHRTTNNVAGTIRDLLDGKV